MSDIEAPPRFSLARRFWQQAVAAGLRFEEHPQGWLLRRPLDYENLPANEQWAIDKALGVLDRADLGEE